jgi:hypothetical protein
MLLVERADTTMADVCGWGEVLAAWAIVAACLGSLWLA